MIQYVKHEFDALMKAVLECHFLHFRPKIQVKKLEITLQKGFSFAPRKFLAKF